MRLKGAQIESTKQGGGLFAGPLVPGWARLYVLAYGAGGNARLFVFEPDPWGDLAWAFGDFYVRGPAREVEHDNNARRAREWFDEIPKG